MERDQRDPQTRQWLSDRAGPAVAEPKDRNDASPTVGLSEVPLVDLAVVGVVLLLGALRSGWDLPSIARRFIDNMAYATPNLVVESLSFENLDTLVSEGIAVYTVPSAPVLERLFAAHDAIGRRKVLGRNLRQILADCENALDACVVAETLSAVSFAREGIAAARDGHSAAAQALWSNTLDSLLRSEFDREVRKQYTQPMTDEERGELAFRDFLVMAPIACGHLRYYPDRGDLVPRTYSRHASTHGVSRRQYSKRNAAQAVMLLTSLIAYLDQLHGSAETVS